MGYTWSQLHIYECMYEQLHKYIFNQSNSFYRQSSGVSSQPSPVPDVTDSAAAKPWNAASIAATDRTEQSTTTPG